MKDFNVVSVAYPPFVGRDPSQRSASPQFPHPHADGRRGSRSRCDRQDHRHGCHLWRKFFLFTLDDYGAYHTVLLDSASRHTNL